jgi:hypothetical protein
MNVLLVWPQVPDTFWSFKHILRFIARKAAFPPLGLLTIAAFFPPHWRLKLLDLNVEPLTDDHLRWAHYVLLSAMLVQRPSAELIAHRCAQLGKTVIAGGPLFTTAHLTFPQIKHFVVDDNFIGNRPRTKILLRELMRQLYEPHTYCQRLRTFLNNYHPTGPRRRLHWPDLLALTKSFWFLGLAHRGRTDYWRLFIGTLLRRPKQFPHAVELLIMGYHFRRVANLL